MKQFNEILEKHRVIDISRFGDTNCKVWASWLIRELEKTHYSMDSALASLIYTAAWTHFFVPPSEFARIYPEPKQHDAIYELAQMLSECPQLWTSKNPVIAVSDVAKFEDAVKHLMGKESENETNQ